MSGFASTKDLADKTVSFDELAPGLYGYTAEGDPNSGVIIGDDSVSSSTPRPRRPWPPTSSPASAPSPTSPSSTSC